MLTLNFMRHSQSNWDGIDGSDFTRPISKKGIQQTQIISKYLEDKKIKFDLIFCSTSLRTKQTLDLLLENSSSADAEVIYDKLLYDGIEENFLLKVSKQIDFKNILVITHEPQILFFINYFLGQTKDNQKILNFETVTSSIISLKFNADNWSDISDVNGSFNYFINPNDI